MTSRKALASLAATLLVGLFASGAPLPAMAAEVGAMVTITDSFRFEPDHVTVRAGEAIEWHNASPFVHTVTDDPKQAGQPGDAALPAGAEAFSSGDLAPGANYRHVLTVPGTYKFFCIPHEGIGMLGEIRVMAAK